MPWSVSDVVELHLPGVRPDRSRRPVYDDGLRQRRWPDHKMEPPSSVHASPSAIVPPSPVK
eukprot:2737496-Pyramimonas_sp.AAC.1